MYYLEQQENMLYKIPNDFLGILSEVAFSQYIT